MSKMKTMGLLAAALAMSVSSQNKMDYQELSKPVHRGSSKIRGKRSNDRSYTIKRLRVNAKRKASGLRPIMSLSRFGGYKIPLV